MSENVIKINKSGTLSAPQFGEAGRQNRFCFTRIVSLHNFVPISFDVELKLAINCKTKQIRLNGEPTK